MIIKKWSGKAKLNPYIYKEVTTMKTMKQRKFNGLNKSKKELLKNLMGSASSKEVDFNKVRDEWKYGVSKL
ncbi:hypothetical protein [Clostridium perfringens]|uniref:hypothetical protein n=1 Tax=Clostridium perfringens TaxID=1502 RepID=UPI000D716583|nr:hypothetical protein [Clostridium perfringens]PWX20909.1 hypothetical protein CYK64_09395 [Clostridium perfringens]TPG00092.1 hypothetical protein CBI46_10005 [Clostridium perfringens A]